MQRFKDYTLREDEIHGKFSSTKAAKIPKRLRGKAFHLVEKLQIQHGRCPYKMLLDHYCPVSCSVPIIQYLLTGKASHENSLRLVPNHQLQQTKDSTSTAFKTQNSISTDSGTSLVLCTSSKIPAWKSSLMDRATPTAMVSAFCRAVLCRLICHEFWGIGDVQAHNESVFYRNVDRFICLRRFETLSLHEAAQGMKVSSTLSLHQIYPCPWHQWAVFMIYTLLQNFVRPCTSNVDGCFRSRTSNGWGQQTLPNTNYHNRISINVWRYTMSSFTTSLTQSLSHSSELISM